MVNMVYVLGLCKRHISTESDIRHQNLSSRRKKKATLMNTIYHNNPKYCDRLALAYSVEPDQMLQTITSDQGLLCSPLIQQFLDLSTSSRMDLCHFQDKYVNLYHCLGIWHFQQMTK